MFAGLGTFREKIENLKLNISHQISSLDAFARGLGVLEP
jgi:hypothetical protein